LVAEHSRHPVVLLVIGFLLTGVLGKVYSDAQDAAQRQREMDVRSVDDLRASFDDLELASMEDLGRAEALILAEERTSIPNSEITAARADYSSAHVRWLDRYAVDSVNIMQRYPMTDDPVIRADSSNVYVALQLLDICLQGAPIRSSPEGDNYVPIVCGEVVGKGINTADNRFRRARNCVYFFALALRPSPGGAHAPTAIPTTEAFDLMRQTCNARSIEETTDEDEKKQQLSEFELPGF
jgi:hypothetical protein